MVFYVYGFLRKNKIGYIVNIIIKEIDEVFRLLNSWVYQMM